MKKHLQCIGVWLLLTVVTCYGNGDKPAKIFRVAYVYGPTELLHHAAEQFAERVNALSEGAIEVRLYPSGQLGNERVLLENLRLRSVDMVLSGLAIVGWYAPEYGAVEAPFVWESYEHVEKVWQGEVGDSLKVIIQERAGISLQQPWYRGPRYLTTTNKEVVHPDDLKGMKLRVPELEVYIKSWQVFGANITPLPFNDMFMALRLGLVEGQENPLATIYANHLHEVQKFIMETRHLIGFYLPVLGPSYEKRFNELEKAIIITALREATNWHNAELEREEENYRKRLIEAGVEFVKVDRDAFRNLAREKIPDQFKSRWKPGLFKAISDSSGAP